MEPGRIVVAVLAVGMGLFAFMGRDWLTRINNRSMGRPESESTPVSAWKGLVPLLGCLGVALAVLLFPFD